MKMNRFIRSRLISPFVGPVFVGVGSLILCCTHSLGWAQGINPSGALTTLPRYIEGADSAAQVPVLSVPALTGSPWLNTEVYVFKDSAYYQTLLQKNAKGLATLDSARLLTLQNQALLFDRVIYPKFQGLFPKDQLISPLPKIALIIDDMDPQVIHRGYVSPRYWLENGIYGMVIDAKLLDNSNTFSSAAFSMVAAHELQHIFSYIYSLRNFSQESSPSGSPTFQEDWLNEGLSEFMQYYVSGVMPQAALSTFATLGKTESIEFWPENSAVTENDYMGSLLWVTYLYYHFGKEQLIWRLIADPRKGMESIVGNIQTLNHSVFNIAPELLTPKSLLANFAIAMGLNSKSVGLNGLFSITGGAYVPELTNFHLVPDLLISGVQSFHLAPHQSIYLKLTSAQSCIHLNNDSGVYAFEIDSASGQAQIQPLPNPYCPDTSDRIWDHIIVILNENESLSQATLRSF